MSNSLKKISSGYFITPNELIRDLSLSPYARTLYCYMASMKDDWNFNNSNLMKVIGVKEDKLRKTIKELIDNGWLSREDKIVKGLKNGYQYSLYSENSRGGVKTDTVENDPLEDYNTTTEEKPAKMQDADENSFKLLWKDYTLTFLKQQDRRGGSKAKAYKAYKTLIGKGYTSKEIYNYMNYHASMKMGHQDLERALNINSIKQYIEDDVK